MAKMVIMYNLAPDVTEEQYEAYVKSDKGPLLDGLGSVKKFELVKMAGSFTGAVPHKYVGIMHLASPDDFNQKDLPSQKFQDFMAKWMPMAADVNILIGDEVY